MSTLVDTNLLTRAAQPQHAMHQTAVDAVSMLRRNGEPLYLVPQNFYEFWVVCTRPVAQNGLGMPPPMVQAEIARLKSLFKVILDDTPAIFPEWEKLVIEHQVTGKSAHDARLVAAMRVHGVEQLLTFNESDFRRYQGITVLTPHDVVEPRVPS
ncbi:MAG: PIN domain-containing protein [Planctomycetaceae bacterium]|nr:PIN domain-containing protein [Planctomycetaceae bacterium]